MAFYMFSTAFNGEDAKHRQMLADLIAVIRRYKGEYALDDLEDSPVESSEADKELRSILGRRSTN